jgi:alpha-L-fucosidase
VTTQRGDSVFVHVLNWVDRVLAVPALGAHVRTARMLRGGEAVPFIQSDDGLTLTLPADEVPDRVIVLETTPLRKPR